MVFPATQVVLPTDPDTDNDTDTVGLTASNLLSSRPLFGGGFAAPRVFSADDLNPFISAGGTLLNPGRYEMSRYVLDDSVHDVLQTLPHAVPVRVPLLMVASRLNLDELATLAKAHRIAIPRRECKDLVLSRFRVHACDSQCGRFVPLFESASYSNDLLNQSFRKEYVDKISGKVKAFSKDEIVEAAGLSGEDLTEYRNGARFVSIDVDASIRNVISYADGKLFVRPVPWMRLARKGTRPVIEELARLHGISFTAKMSKSECLQELERHKCVRCRAYYAIFEPLNPAPVKPVKKSPPRLPDPVELDLDSFDTSDAEDNLSMPDYDDESPHYPPAPLSEAEQFDIVRDICNGMKPSAFEESGCAVCGQLNLLSDLTALEDITCSLDPLIEPNLARIERKTSNDPIAFHSGPVLDSSCRSICRRCLSSLDKGKRPVTSLSNGLWVGAVPKVLADLTYVEQLLVSRVRTNRHVVRISSGHTKMTGNAIAFANPTPKVYQRLPPRRDELDDVLAIIFTGKQPPTDQDMERTPMLVRRNAVADALEWLRLNHCDYTDLHVDADALSTYPETGIPVKVMFRHTNEEETTITTATSVHDTGEEQGTSSGECTFTVHGLVGARLDSMSLLAKKATAIDHLKSGGHVLTVGHSKDPESIFDNHQLYPQMFPWLFPYGSGGFRNSRTRGLISETRHKKILLMYHDKRFQVESRFVISAFNHEQIKAGTSSSFLLTKRANFSDIVSNLSKIDPAVVKNIANRLQSGEKVIPHTDAEKACFSILDRIDHVGGNVHGSMAGKKNMRSELWSLISFAGAPSWFITISPVDNKHPICIYMADNKENFIPDLREYNDRARLVAKNPVAGARFFHFLVKLFIKHALRWGDKDGRAGLFGKTAAYYGTVEQQGRMTLHLHILIWIAGALSPQETRDKLVANDSDFVREIIEYLESCHIGEFLTGDMDDMERRYGKKPTNGGQDDDDTLVRDDPIQQLPDAPPTTSCPDFMSCGCDACLSIRDWRTSFMEKVDRIVFKSNRHQCFTRRDVKQSDGKYKQHATGKGCINKDGVCTVRFPRALYHRTTVDKEGRIYIKKKEAWINTITPVLSYSFRCNTDSTSLTSGTAVKATAGYVADYIVKLGLKTYQIFSSIYDVFEKNQDIWTESKSDTDAARKLIMKMANSLTSQIEIGGPMAAMYLLGNPDHYSSHSFVILYWKQYVLDVLRTWDVAQAAREDAPCARSSTRISTFEIAATGDADDALETDDEDGVDDMRDEVVLSRNAVGYISRSNVDDYKLRPTELDDICLYEWTQCSTRIHNRNNKEPGKNQYRYQPDHPLHKTHLISFDPRRRNWVVPNIVGPFLPRIDSDDKDFYCCTMMTLFSPWRTGFDLKSSSQSWVDAYGSYSFSERHAGIIKNFNIRYECYDARDDYHAQIKLTVAEQEYENDGEEGDDDADIDAEGLGEQYVAEASDVGHWTQTRRDQMKDVEGVLLRAGWVVDGTMFVSPDGTHFSPEKALSASKWKEIVATEKKKSVQGSRCNDAAMGPTEDDMNVDVCIVNDARVVPGAYLLSDFHLRDKDLLGLMDKIRGQWTLNAEQDRAFTIAVHHSISVDPEPLRMYLGGMGGTGKSRVIKALLQWFKERGEEHRMVVLAPTGAAASVVNGSTYHSHLGLRPGDSGHNLPREGPALDEARRKMRGVDYVFIDEVSMVSCRHMHMIDARLKRITQVDDVPFGGLSMIVAGDFAQLPPAKSGNPLYSGEVSKDQLPRQTIKDQEETLGMLMWHHFVVVVILVQNMRQIEDSPDDVKLRACLERMRYKSCTEDDFDFLRSRMPCYNDQINLNDDKFKNTSIITSWNAHKDQINAMNATRFASERKMKLHHFYSVDRQSYQDGARKRKKKSAVDDKPVRLTPDVQNALWDSPPHTSDHIAGSIPLCLGMPVMIRNNEATELCMTKGQEGRVKGWTCREIPGHPRKYCLDVLFVELVNPAKSVKLPHLEVNVVPITKISTHIKATLPNDQSISISRSQVPILLNFSMTDYTSQGKTRPVNIVDLVNSRNHQAVYVALSRGESAADTVILRDFNMKKISGGLDGYLRQEFRELDILNRITKMQFDGELPGGILQRLRKPTLDAFKGYLRTGVEPSQPAAGVKRVGEEWTQDARELKKIKLSSNPVANSRVKRPTQATRKHATGARFTKVNRKSAKPHTAVKSKAAVVGKRAVVKSTKPAPRRVKATSGPSRTAVTPAPSAETAVGLSPSSIESSVTVFGDRLSCGSAGHAFKSNDERDPGWMSSWMWDSVDWSCAFDSLATILRFVWYTDKKRWSTELSGMGQYAREMVVGFDEIDRGLKDVSCMRSDIRTSLWESKREAFPRGRQGTDIFTLAQTVLGVTRLGEEGICSSCGHSTHFFATDAIGRYVIMKGNVESRCSLSKVVSRIDRGTKTCDRCRGRVSMGTGYCPELMAIQLPGGTHDTIEQNLEIDKAMKIRGGDYSLRGIVYYGASDFHFSSRLFDAEGIMYRYDGMVNRGLVQVEGVGEAPSGFGRISTDGHRTASLAIYVRNVTT